MRGRPPRHQVAAIDLYAHDHVLCATGQRGDVCDLGADPPTAHPVAQCGDGVFGQCLGHAKSVSIVVPDEGTVLS